ncbi:uncharacterized protein BDR25DRAFT_362064 [Lindgomyces ingoldianus]|uniref:Uncharacterized protein n=1 Tax=Lindgomyces ingoldianus TaxID=673940 RepID=A0ACB6QB95_9PLEO|nr:uncharacterized protein BDR25DRAFT_362064 [Lindgomyces ingoldianus]KAF2464130.1 hypothetical protein BDR25DRAFT_362064 [Lindgomyces ingoldianus]
MPVPSASLKTAFVSSCNSAPVTSESKHEIGENTRSTHCTCANKSLNTLNMLGSMDPSMEHYDRKSPHRLHCKIGIAPVALIKSSPAISWIQYIQAPLLTLTRVSRDLLACLAALQYKHVMASSLGAPFPIFSRSSIYRNFQHPLSTEHPPY